MKLDENDQKIIAALREDSSLSTRRIAKKILLPVTTVHNRIKKLVNEGVIERFTIEVNNKKVGLTLSAYILLKLEFKHLFKRVGTQQDLASVIMKFPQVRSVDYLTGQYDAIIHALFKDIDDLNYFITYQLTKLGGVKETITFMVLKEG